MNVAFYFSGYNISGCGISAYIYQMSRALRQSGHYAVVITNREAGRPDVEETDAGTIYRVYDKSKIRSRAAAHSVFSLASKLNIDIIEGADHYGDCASLLAMSIDIPVMIKVHCSNVVNVLYESEVLYPWQRIMIRLAYIRNIGQIRAEWLSIKNADLLCAPSMRLIQELKKQPFLKNRPIGLIPNPFTTSSLPPCQESAMPTILFVGRLSIGKGISYLPAIMNSLWKIVPECRLIIAGGDSYARGIGSLKNWLVRRFAAKINYVSFTGNLHPDALTKIYDRAWVVIMPSRWDNFPSVVLEALARAKPVVASPHGGMPEMLENTRNIIADPETKDFPGAVYAFLKNKSLRRRAGADGLKRLQAVYKPEEVAKQYTVYVQQALASLRHPHQSV